MAESVRSFWKGHLRLALVTIPVRLVSAQKSDATVQFHQIDRKSKQRVRYLKVVPGQGEVAKEDIVMGYELEPGNYVLFEGDEIDALKLDTRHTIELTQFVEACEIDPLYFERPYYVLPDGEVAEEGYRVIRDALRAAKKVGLGQLTLRGREHLVALYPGGDGLVLDTLRYESEVKDADEIFSGIGREKSRADMMEMAQELIRSRSAPFDASAFKNHYSEALRALVQQKVSSGGAVPVDETKPGGAKVLDFMEALRRSVGGETGKADKPSAKKDDDAPPKRRVAAKSAKAADTKKGPAKSPASKPPRKPAKKTG